MFGETPNSWYSKKEPVVALCSCEVRCIVASLCVCQILWLMNILKELCREAGEATTLMVDNCSAINLIKNLITHRRSKHIGIKFYYLRELVSEGRLGLGYCRSEYQVTDLLIKEVSIEVFKRLKKHVSIKYMEHMN